MVAVGAVSNCGAGAVTPRPGNSCTLQVNPPDNMTLWRRPRSPDWVELDQRFDEMRRRIDRALEECRRDMRRFEESFFPASRYGEPQKVRFQSELTWEDGSFDLGFCSANCALFSFLELVGL